MASGKMAIKEILMGIKTVPDEQFDREEAERLQIEQEERIREVMRLIPKRYRDLGLESYEFYGTEPQQSKQHKLISYLSDAKSLVMYGNNGTGKTMLAFASMKKQLEKGMSVKYETFMEIMDKVHQCFNSEKVVGEIVLHYSEFDYLVIDEIDKSYGSKSELINLFRIVNSRYNDKKATVLITNAGPLDKLDKDGNMCLGVINSVGRSSYERIVEDGTAIYMDWDSYRGNHLDGK